MNTSSLTFLLQQSDVEVSPESPKPTTFSISKLTDKFSFLACILPQQPPLMSLLLQAVAEHKPFTCPSHNLFQLGQFFLNLQWPEGIYLEHNWHIKTTCWIFLSFIPQGRSTCKEEIPYFNTFPWIIKSLRLERISKMILSSPQNHVPCCHIHTLFLGTPKWRVTRESGGLEMLSHVHSDTLSLHWERNKGKAALGNRGETEWMDFPVTCSFSWWGTVGPLAAGVCRESHCKLPAQQSLSYTSVLHRNICNFRQKFKHLALHQNEKPECNYIF